MFYTALPESSHELVSLRPIRAEAREGLLRRYRMVRGTPGDFWIYAHVVGIDAACEVPVALPRQPAGAM